MEEISLRELIEILLKRKTMIIAITAIAIIVAGLLSFFVLDPIYEANTILNVQNISYSTHSGNVNGTNIFLNNENMDWNELSQIDPGISQDSRALILSLIEYPSMSEEAYANKLLGHELLTKVKERIPELSHAKIGSIKSKINIESKNGLFTIKIKDKDPKIATAIGNELAAAFISYVDSYNSDYVDRLDKYIIAAIENQEKDLNELASELKMADLANDDNKLKQLKIKQDISKQIYEVLLFKEKQLNLIQMMDFGDKNVAVIRKAYEPEKPVSPNKKLNVAIAAVLGLMIGVFAAFFIEYWKESGLEKEKVGNTNEIL